ncbi:thioesterase family protein [Oceanicoccus sp. KOV_DT_Chl]|uniref:acyl-CoA thioesterase n=1 Tax=Oceanicoccus sp. KOV_DT_Chl TaxID=1904639 RepID=UPI000C79A402|nr:thioesterase family protein [Oceanicoccus sp. KOV_DT_Chl]
MQNHHEYPIDVRWGEMDALGHVNNTEYLRYFESARVEWFEGMGSHLVGGEVGPVVLKSTTLYHLPVIYPNRLKVVTRVERVGNTSYTLAQQLRGRDDDALYTESDLTCVWVDRVTGGLFPLRIFCASFWLSACRVKINDHGRNCCRANLSIIR